MEQFVTQRTFKFASQLIRRCGCLLSAAMLLVGCSELSNVLDNAIQWENGHPVATESLKCATCHEKDRPTSLVTLTRTTESGREFVVSFHNMTPTGFNEDPSFYYDCNKCHSRDLGWRAGTFGPSGKPHLPDSSGNKVKVCLNCHTYPQNFWKTEHTMASSLGYDCQNCHLGPNEVGGTQRGGFGSE